MIVKMSKYVFMVYHKEYDQFLQELRDLGVLLVKEINSIRDDAALQSLLGERKQIGQAIRFCEGLNKGADAAPSAAVPANKEEGLRAAEQLEALQEKKAKLLATKAGLEKDLAYMEVWGDFDYTNIRLLKEAGYELNFFSCPTSHYEPKWGEEYNAFLKEELEASMRLEPGVMTLYATAEKENPNRITILEIYADQEAYRTHIQTPHFLKYKQGTLDMVISLELVDSTPLIPGLKIK